MHGLAPAFHGIRSPSPTAACCRCHTTPVCHSTANGHHGHRYAPGHHTPPALICELSRYATDGRTYGRTDGDTIDNTIRDRRTGNTMRIRPKRSYRADTRSNTRGARARPQKSKIKIKNLQPRLSLVWGDLPSAQVKALQLPCTLGDHAAPSRPSNRHSTPSCGAERLSLRGGRYI